MKLHKRLLRSSFIQALFAYLIYLYARAIYKTTHWDVIGKEYRNQVIDSGRPFIGLFWHGRILLAANVPHIPFPLIHVMISKHGDGDFIARVIRHFGYSLVRGSSRKQGAVSAIHESLAILASGKHLAITPDGPRGPRMRVNSHVIDIAKMSGALILPFSVSASGATALNSWDRFLLPKLFQKGVIIFDAPMEVPAHTTKQEAEHLRLELEKKMIAMSQKADSIVGVSPILPA